MAITMHDLAQMFLGWCGANYDEETLIGDIYLFLREMRTGRYFDETPTAEQLALQEKTTHFDLNDWDELIDRVREIRGRGQ
jgi:hypothetical protein